MATDSRIDTWTAVSPPSGDEIIPVQTAAGTARVITPTGIAQSTAFSPYYYGFSASGTPSDGNTLVGAGVYPLTFPTTQINTIGTDWDEVNYEFTCPVGKGGMWMIGMMVAFDDVSGGGGGKPSFSMALQGVLGGGIVGGDQMILSKDDLSTIPTLSLALSMPSFLAAGDSVSVQLETDFDDTFTYDLVGSTFRVYYLGTS